jgi:rare lipoprotein A
LQPRAGKERWLWVVAFAALAGAAGCAKTVPPATTSTVREVPPPSRAGVVRVIEGKASWYGREQHHHLTANGERFDMYALTAAHRTLHMNTQVRVINLRNGRSTVVRINDRGPYGGRCIIDVSYAAAKQLDMVEAGIVPVRLEVLGP